MRAQTLIKNTLRRDKFKGNKIFKLKLEIYKNIIKFNSKLNSNKKKVSYKINIL